MRKNLKRRKIIQIILTKTYMREIEIHKNIREQGVVLISNKKRDLQRQKVIAWFKANLEGVFIKSS